MASSYAREMAERVLRDLRLAPAPDEETEAVEAAINDVIERCAREAMPPCGGSSCGHSSCQGRRAAAARIRALKSQPSNERGTR